MPLNDALKMLKISSVEELEEYAISRERGWDVDRAGKIVRFREEHKVDLEVSLDPGDSGDFRGGRVQGGALEWARCRGTNVYSTRWPLAGKRWKGKVGGSRGGGSERWCRGCAVLSLVLISLCCPPPLLSRLPARLRLLNRVRARLVRRLLLSRGASLPAFVPATGA